MGRFQKFFLQIVHSFIVFKNMLLIFKKKISQIFENFENLIFEPEKHKTGNTAKFRPHSQKRTSDSESATQN